VKKIQKGPKIATNKGVRGNICLSQKRRKYNFEKEKRGGDYGV
jgi:hypothetical protein